MAELPILIIGLPRSGTTWVGQILSSAQGTTYIFEPDNEKLSPLAWLCKEGLHRFPYLTPNDYAPAYRQMWQTAFAGRNWSWLVNNAAGLVFRKRAFLLEAYVGEKTGFSYTDDSLHTVSVASHLKPYHIEKHPLLVFLLRQLLLGRYTPLPGYRTIIKSVHAPLSIAWIVAQFPVKIVLTLRNPFSLYASYKRMKMPDGFRNLLFQQNLQRDRLQYLPDWKDTLIPSQEDAIACQIMLMYKIIEAQASVHPEWIIVSHDRLCITPHEGFRSIFADLAWFGLAGLRPRLMRLMKQGRDLIRSGYPFSSHPNGKLKSVLKNGKCLNVGLTHLICKVF